MQPARAPVRRELARVDPPLQLLRPAAPEERRLAAVLRQAPVEEDRKLELVAEPVGEARGRSRARDPRPRGRIGTSGTHVRGTDARVRADVRAEVDELDGARAIPATSVSTSSSPKPTSV